MPNYRETEATGTQWQRCKQILIDNPLGGAPRVFMSEELVVQLAGETFLRPAEGIEFAFDPVEAIALLDPATGTATGKAISAADLYVALWSLYMAKAAARDAAAAPSAVEPVAAPE